MKAFTFTPGLRMAAAAAALLTLQASAMAADGYVTTNEAKLDTIFSQAGFAAADKIDIRFNRETSIIDAALTTIDDAADWTKLNGLAGNLASPMVNMYFVDKILWCGDPSLTTIGCAKTPGNVLALDSSWAANATYGGNLAGHELAHNLSLEHLLPDDGSNLMNPTISTSSKLTAGQITAILASALVQSDGSGKFITIQPIAVLGAAPIPEPAEWALLLLGGAVVAGVARSRRGGLRS